MRKTSLKMISVFMALFMLISTVLFSVPANAAAAPALSATSLSVYVGKTATLKMKNTNAKVAWATSNKGIATVDSKGVVKGIKAGNANITATVNKKKYVCKVTVKNAPAPALSATKLSVYVGKTATLQMKNTNAKVAWSTSNKSIATVNSKGVVKGIKAGNANITATVNKKKYVCKVTVKKQASSKPTPKPTKKPVIKVAGIKLSLAGSTSSTNSINIGTTGNVIATIAPANATNKTVSWKTSNADILSINSNGQVVAKKVGTAKITATAVDGSKKTASISIKVVRPVIKVSSITVRVESGYSSTILDNGNTSLIAVVSPSNASNTAVKWSSSSSSIASVDSSGYVTGKKAGTVTIKATAADGSKVYGSIVITVKPAVTTKVTSVKVSVAPGCSDRIYDNNGKTKLNAEVLPANASIRAVTWKSSSSTIATVDDSGNVTGLKAGTATVTATATDGSRKYGSLKITVLQTGEVQVSRIANKTQTNIKKALTELSFSIIVDPQSSNGCDGVTRSIILSEYSDTFVYHELGHFLAYVSGNRDKTSEFASIYNSEKTNYPGNKSRISNASEYFAQAYEDYTKSASALRKACPQTYNYIKACINDLGKLVKEPSFSQMNLAGLKYNCGK